MKTHFLITTALFTSFAFLSAQANPDERPAPANAPKGAPAPISNPDGDNNVVLPQGTLKNTVTYIEEKLMPQWRDYIGNMPNILLTKDAAECPLPGPLILHRVSPLQAVVLAAAAADCSVESITSPAESLEASTPPAIIGYRIMRNKAPSSGSGNVSLNKTSATSETTQPMRAADDSGRPVVRVYALGTILRAKSGGEQNKTEIVLTNEQKILTDLVSDALKKAGSGSPQPEFTIHPESRALVVKATAGQQEIVQQVVQAMKENEQSEAHVTIPASR